MRWGHGSPRGWGDLKPPRRPKESMGRFESTQALDGGPRIHGETNDLGQPQTWNGDRANFTARHREVIDPWAEPSLGKHECRTTLKTPQNRQSSQSSECKQTLRIRAENANLPSLQSPECNNTLRIWAENAYSAISATIILRTTLRISAENAYFAISGTFTMQKDIADPCWKRIFRHLCNHQNCKKH